MSNAVTQAISQTSSQTAINPDDIPFSIMGTRLLPSWLNEQQVSLVFTTYQNNKLFFVGLENGRLAMFERTFPRAMGLAVSSDYQTLYLSCQYQLWRLENALESGQRYESYDANYIPQVAYTTGDIDIHDIAIDSQGKVIFANTLFSCLATVSEKYSFEPIWMPPFITKLAAEDRCHLNGLALRDGQARYVSMVSVTDIAQGWREHRQGGGVVMDIQSNEVVCSNLSMPHSPRWYQNKLWVLEAGTGYFGYVDEKTNRFERMTFCPGFLRGLSFINQYAIVGTSKGRGDEAFKGLALEQNLAQKKISDRCSLQIIDIRTGDRIHSLQLEGVINELYDVGVLRGIQHPRAVGIRSAEVGHSIKLPPGTNITETMRYAK